ncbi:hypothetical protein SAMN05660209_01660 [Geodermatophilus africanus]|uniref:Uncharacterized protein n=1 Tax=Geodermatophilus africanus TaxID=1137993 RepID=A0A1H3FYR1_9ACTN|nr:hypothetical protein [Geodermatophilus africanus]SDX96202.1 hypothetical protein SAMN05660209_01660 [Geodermatophilus africanus]
MPPAARDPEGDAGQDWTAQDLRLSVEQDLLGGGVRLDTDLLGRS